MCESRTHTMIIPLFAFESPIIPILILHCVFVSWRAGSNKARPERHVLPALSGCLSHNTQVPPPKKKACQTEHTVSPVSVSCSYMSPDGSGMKKARCSNLVVFHNEVLQCQSLLFSYSTQLLKIAFGPNLQSFVRKKNYGYTFLK